MRQPVPAPGPWVPLVFCSMGVALMGLCTVQIAIWAGVQGRPIVEGRILSTSGTGSCSRCDDPRTVVYEYTWNGQPFRGDRVVARGVLEPLHWRIDAGDFVDVYVDPADPSDSFLSPGSPSAFAFLYLLGAGFVWIALPHCLLGAEFRSAAWQAHQLPWGPYPFPPASTPVQSSRHKRAWAARSRGGLERIAKR